MLINANVYCKGSLPTKFNTKIYHMKYENFAIYGSCVTIVENKDGTLVMVPCHMLVSGIGSTL